MMLPLTRPSRPASPLWLLQYAAIALVLLGASSSVQAHGGEGDHFSVGYYFGHDGSFENPASPAWPATLLVDPHPWELSAQSHPLAPVDSVFLKGWLSQTPGFEALAAEDQEFDGHGFYSWRDPDYPRPAPAVQLHVDHLDAGLQILDPDTLQPVANPLSFSAAFPHTHFAFFVDESENPAMKDVYTATFHLSDSTHSLADSEPFTVSFQIVPDPTALAMLAMGAALSARRRHATCG